MLFKGYIDESYDQDFFVLSCTISAGDVWTKFETEWKRCLEVKNAQLKEQGRQVLSRYHATDCQGKYGEFKGWSNDEQVDFTKSLLAALELVPIHSSAYTLVLSDVRDSYAARYKTPMSVDMVLQAAYTLTVPFCMESIGSLLALHGDQSRITLFYDQCDHETMIHGAFNRYQRENTDHGHMYSTIAALNSRECLPLQAADFIAYEFFKDRKNEELQSGRDQRKSLAALLKQGAGVILKTIPIEVINQIVDINLGVTS